MTEAERRTILEVIDLLNEYEETLDGDTYGPATVAAIRLMQLLQVGPEWQEDGE